MCPLHYYQASTHFKFSSLHFLFLSFVMTSLPFFLSFFLSIFSSVLKYSLHFCQWFGLIFPHFWWEYYLSDKLQEATVWNKIIWTEEKYLGKYICFKFLFFIHKTETDSQLIQCLFRHILLYTCFNMGFENMVSYFGEDHKLQVFENRVLRKMFGWKMDEVSRIFITGNCDFCRAPSIVRIVKSRWLRWGRLRDAYCTLVGRPWKAAIW